MRSPSFSGCPWESVVTLAPSLGTRPVISCPRMRGPGPIMAMRISPRHTCRSEPQMPAEVTRTMMASGSGSGTGYSRISKGLPVSKKTAALPVSGMLPPSGKLSASLPVGRSACRQARSVSSPPAPYVNLAAVAPAASGFEVAAAGAIMVGDDGSAGRKVGLGLELAPLRRRRPGEGRRPATEGGLSRRPHQGPRRPPLVRPGPPLARDRRRAQGGGAGHRRLGLPLRPRPRRGSAARRRDGLLRGRRPVRPRRRSGVRGAARGGGGALPARSRAGRTRLSALLQQLRNHPLPPLLPLRRLRALLPRRGAPGLLERLSLAGRAGRSLDLQRLRGARNATAEVVSGGWPLLRAWRTLPRPG